jgi:hypothetical protein
VVNLKAEEARLDFLGYQYPLCTLPVSTGASLLAPGAVDQGPGTGTGDAAANDRLGRLRQADPPARVRAEPTPEGRAYFQLGYPQRAFRKIGWYVRERLVRPLRRRSQRPFRAPGGTTWYRQLLDPGLLPM